MHSTRQIYVYKVKENHRQLVDDKRHLKRTFSQLAWDTFEALAMSEHFKFIM